VGPLPTSGRQNRFILSIIDHFSKFAVAMPTQRQDTATVIDCMTKFCSQFGIPTRILSDQGRSLISREFLEWCKAWGIRKATSTSYHPQTQGLCERYNQTIIGILKKYVYECTTTWCERLPMAVYAYNSAVQETIGVTPFEINNDGTETCIVC
jgi:transposase InsO family protein